MPLLEMHAAAAGIHGVLSPPVSLSLEHGGRLAYACLDAPTAEAVAMLACAMLPPARGAVYVGAYDTRIQPVHVKRMTAFVPHLASQLDFGSFAQYVAYRADLCGTVRAAAIERAARALTLLRGVHEAFAYPLAAALAASPKLLVLDRPQPLHARAIGLAAEGCALFSTHANEADAAAFQIEASLA